MQEAPYAFKIFFLSVLLVLEFEGDWPGITVGLSLITPVSGVGRESLAFNLAAKIVEPQGINGLFLLQCNSLNTAKKMKRSVFLEFGIALKAVDSLQHPNATWGSSTWTSKAFSRAALRISFWVLWGLWSFSVCFFSPFSLSVRVCLRPALTCKLCINCTASLRIGSRSYVMTNYSE